MLFAYLKLCPQTEGQTVSLNAPASQPFSVERGCGEGTPRSGVGQRGFRAGQESRYSEGGKRAETKPPRGFEGREERNKLALEEGARSRGLFRTQGGRVSC